MFNQLSTIEQIEQNVALAPFTTFKLGGVARLFLRAKNKAQVITALQMAQAEKIPVFILGGGSDILVSERGFPGLVIKMELNQQRIINEQQLYAEAGVPINGAIRFCMQQGFSGLEYASGVPASIGGAIWANLGCRGSDISQVLHSVEVCDLAGNKKTFSNQACQFSYRASRFKHERWVILAATFNLQTKPVAELKQTVLTLTKLKSEQQDIGVACAGCAFRNPLTQTTKSAGQLIDELGLKGYQIGGAKISEKHGNFILNTGTATVNDLVQLISYVKQQVRDKTGVQLMEEVDYVGF
ncbi:MAG: UDP-N-acetylmuramate dehydrogenase [Patescibacteria group bacterium]|jgi:UDP-N-acetylmuramate dehydrogenase